MTVENVIAIIRRRRGEFFDVLYAEGPDEPPVCSNFDCVRRVVNEYDSLLEEIETFGATI